MQTKQIFIFYVIIILNVILIKCKTQILHEFSDMEIIMLLGIG